MLKIITTKHKRKIMIESISWAARCYFKGFINFKSAIGHIESAYCIVK